MNDNTELQRLQDILTAYLNEYYHGRHDVHTHDDGRVTYHVYLRTLDSIIDFVTQLYREYGDEDADMILYDDDLALFYALPDINYDLGTKFKLTLGTISWRKQTL